MEYEYRKHGNVTYRVRKRRPNQHGERMQDEYGRFYHSAAEKRSASGNMIKIFLWFTRDDPKIGTILFHRQWLHGSSSFPRLGPKKWIKILEKDLDKIIQRAINKLNKEFDTNTVELVSMEGWQITNKKVVNLSDCRVYSPPLVRIKHGT